MKIVTVILLASLWNTAGAQELNADQARNVAKQRVEMPLLAKKDTVYVDWVVIGRNSTKVKSGYIVHFTDQVTDFWIVNGKPVNLAKYVKTKPRKFNTN